MRTLNDVIDRLENDAVYLKAAKQAILDFVGSDDSMRSLFMGEIAHRYRQELEQYVKERGMEFFVGRMVKMPDGRSLEKELAESQGSVK